MPASECALLHYYNSRASKYEPIWYASIVNRRPPALTSGPLTLLSSRLKKGKSKRRSDRKALGCGPSLPSISPGASRTLARARARTHTNARTHKHSLFLSHTLFLTHTPPTYTHRCEFCLNAGLGESAIGHSVYDASGEVECPVLKVLPVGVVHLLFFFSFFLDA